MKKKKVMFFIESFDFGGVAKVLYDLVRLLDKNKYEITVYSIYDGGVYKNELPKEVKFKYILKEKRGFKRKLFNFMIYRYPNKIFYSIFIKKRYDVEIAFMENYPTKVISCSANTKSKKIAWVHCDLVKNTYSDSIYNSVEEHEEAYKIFDKIVFVSHSAMEAFKSKYKIMENIEVINNPLMYEEILENIEGSSYNDDFKGIRILTIGRLNSEKGQDIIIKVCNKLKNNGIDFKWYLIGEGSLRKELEEEIIKYNLNNEICLLGSKLNPYPYLNDSDIYVQTSIHEGYCMTLKEAIALKKPIITTMFEAAFEQITNGKDGFIVNRDEESIYKALKILMENKQLREEFSNNLYGKITSNEHIIKCVTKLLEI